MKEMPKAQKETRYNLLDRKLARKYLKLSKKGRFGEIDKMLGENWFCNSCKSFNVKSIWEVNSNIRLVSIYYFPWHWKLFLWFVRV